MASALRCWSTSSEKPRRVPSGEGTSEQLGWQQAAQDIWIAARGAEHDHVLGQSFENKALGKSRDGTQERAGCCESKLPGEKTSRWPGTSGCCRATFREPFEMSQGADLQGLESDRDGRSGIVLGSRNPFS